MAPWDINKFDTLYRVIKHGVGVDGEIVYIKLDPPPPGWVRILTHVTVENLDEDAEKTRIGIERTGRKLYLDEIDAPLENELIVSRSDIILGEGDVFFAEFTGTENHNKLILTAIGWEQKL